MASAKPTNLKRRSTAFQIAQRKDSNANSTRTTAGATISVATNAPNAFGSMRLTKRGTSYYAHALKALRTLPLASQTKVRERTKAKVVGQTAGLARERARARARAKIDLGGDGDMKFESRNAWNIMDRRY